MLSKAEIENTFTQIISTSLRVDPASITPESHIMNDLGAESLDMIEITMEVESAFNICLPEKSILDTAVEVFGPGVLVVDDRLTEAGKQLLRHRLGASEAAALEGVVMLKDLRSSLMTVRAWTRMIEHLAVETPAVCATCGGALKPDLGSRMACAACRTSVPVPMGEDINREWVAEYYRSVYLPSLNAGGGITASASVAS